MKTNALDIAVGIVLAHLFMKGGEALECLAFALADNYHFHRELQNGYMITIVLMGVLFPVVAYYVLRDKG